MASLYKLEVGEEMELRRVLSRAGFTMEMAKAVIADASLAECMVDALRARLQTGEHGLVKKSPVAVKDSASHKLPDVLTLTLGCRTYVAHHIIESYASVDGRELLVRAHTKNATSGQEDAEWFLSHQDEIRINLDCKAVFVFTEWRKFDNIFMYVAVIRQIRGRLVHEWERLEKRDWVGIYRPVQRIS